MLGLGVVYERLGRKKEEGLFYKRALAGRGTVLGVEHVNTVRIKLRYVFSISGGGFETCGRPRTIIGRSDSNIHFRHLSRYSGTCILRCALTLSVRPIQPNALQLPLNIVGYWTSPKVGPCQRIERLVAHALRYDVRNGGKDN